MGKAGQNKVLELLSASDIANKISELGALITKSYPDESEELVLIGVLKGSFIFLADLCRAIDRPLEVDMIGVSSYGSSITSSGSVLITQDLWRPIKNKHVLLVEDIFETGLTIKFLIENLKERGPKSIKVCALLKKEDKSLVDLPIDFLGFIIPDEFVVGYGLDAKEKLRNLEMIGVIKAD